jgi:hypothetical protein
VVGWLEAKEAARHSAHAADALTNAMIKHSIFPYFSTKRLASALAAIAVHLDGKDVARVVAALTQALAKTDDPSLGGARGGGQPFRRE